MTELRIQVCIEVLIRMVFPFMFQYINLSSCEMSFTIHKFCNEQEHDERKRAKKKQKSNQTNEMMMMMIQMFYFTTKRSSDPSCVYAKIYSSFSCANSIFFFLPSFCFWLSDLFFYSFHS